MIQKIKTIVLSIVLVGLTFTTAISVYKNSELTKELKATQESLTQANKDLQEYMDIYDDSLTEWDKFTLALMKVESNYDITAESSAGARGYFQLMPIYVKEVNRVYKTNYKFEEVVKSFEQSYEVFMLMQTAHNENFSMDKALVLHNGNHKWYHQRVYNELEKIEKYEEMRKMLKEANETNETISIPY
jgi:hypothetical protein